MLNILGVDAGNGVIVHPLKDHLVGNLEPRGIFHSKEERQWFSNFSVPIFKDKETCYKHIKDVDVIIGNPDCGHSSILAYSRAKKFSDPHDNESLNTFFQAIQHYKPVIWLMENLPALLQAYTKEDFIEMFRDYQLSFIIGSVTQLGNSQKDRVRLVITGVHKDMEQELGRLKYIGLTRNLSKFYRVNEPTVCRNLFNGIDVKGEDKSIGHIREDIDTVITLYGGFKMPLREIQRHWEHNWCEKRWKVTGENFTTAPGVYRNLDDGFPATARKANRQFNQLGLTMSPRELARIQGVPDSFNIAVGSRKNYWINKGRASVTKCPPYELGVWFYDVLKSTIPNLLK